MREIHRCFHVVFTCILNVRAYLLICTVSYLGEIEIQALCVDNETYNEFMTPNPLTYLGIYFSTVAPRKQIGAPTKETKHGGDIYRSAKYH